MTDRIFSEPSPEYIAHTPTSRLLVEDKKTTALISYFTDTLKLGAAHECDALERWPGSLSSRETGISIGLGNPGQTSIYEEMATNLQKKERFSNAMQALTAGEGFELSTLVENYAWDKLGGGTLVDVSVLK